jgi:hypothetical protein
MTGKEQEAHAPPSLSAAIHARTRSSTLASVSVCVAQTDVLFLPTYSRPTDNSQGSHRTCGSFILLAINIHLRSLRCQPEKRLFRYPRQSTSLQHQVLRPLASRQLSEIFQSLRSFSVSFLPSFLTI